MRKLFSVLSSTLQGGVRAVLLLLALFASVSAIYASDTQVDGIWYDFKDGSQVESVDFSAQGYVNSQTISSYHGTHFSVSFDKGTNSNLPKYYDNGTAIRVYGGGYFIITSESTITKIVVEFGSSDGSNAISTNAGTFSNGTWIGNSNSVKFTIGGQAGHRRIQKITVTTFSDTKVASVTYRGSASDSDEAEYSGSVVIPETVTYNGTTYSVTSIGDGAFEYCSKLTSVTIPNSVTSIGEEAFEYCSKLTSVTIPNSVTSIGNYAFIGCLKLTSVAINSDAIVNKAYSSSSNISRIFGSQVTEYIIGDDVKGIGEYAFYDCSKLTSVTIGESVTSIGYYAFGGWTSLTKTNYTGDIAGWCNIMFGSYYANPMCRSRNFYINDQEIKDLVIPNNVTSIGNYAFEGCSSLTSVTIGESVTSIGDEAFRYCDSLTSVTIGESVTSIGEEAFHGCSKLTSVTINSEDIVSKDYSFNPNISDIFGSQVTEYIIGDNVRGIGHYAFSDCSSLTSVTIPNSVTSIGYYAFGGCTSLTSVTIPNSVTSIGTGAFYGCSSLTSVTIPNSVTSIGSGAFYGCSSLTSVTIPNSVTSIGDYAFYSCYSLTSITCEAETPPAVGKDAFSSVLASIPVYVPCGCVEAYKAASGWEAVNTQEHLAEFSISLTINDSNMGTAKVDKNTACSNQISAIANYGYHFVRWSDGNTDNPRSLELTQDTVLTSEFAPNKYTITTVSSDTQRGTTQGDTTVNYLEYITISATANYGYHFVRWNDGNKVNPRQVKVTKDMTYSAYFDKNTYAISLSCNKEQGSVDGVTSAEYLETVTISALPNIGYHFVQWSDGATENPRTLELTQDTILIAEFAQSFSGQCGDDLYWSYDETAKTISITGSGKMYDFTADTQPWLLFKEQIVEVTTTNTVTSIGTSAFEGCARLSKISLGTGLEKIAANAFAGCTRLYDIYVYATYPPFTEESSFANYNVYVYIPCEYQRDYILDVVWGKFKFIECIDSEEVTTDDVVVTPGINDVTITWPTEDNADIYTIVIKKDGEVFCTLTFNAEGQLLNIAFAPGRNGNRPAQYAEQAGKGYRFTVTNLESGTKYGYNIEVKDASNKTIKSHSGEFTTQSTTAVDNITTNNANIQKIMRDGQFIIIRNGVEYNAVGQEM